MNERLTPIATKPSSAPPKGWRWALLSEVAKLESGHTPSRRVPDYWDGGAVPWLSLKDISGLTGKFVHDTVDHPTQRGIDNSSARLLPALTVAFCRTASVGKSAILGREMATSQDFVNWICGAELDPEYLHLALRSSTAFFDKEKQGSTHKTIYVPTVKRFQVLLPPLAEQKRIAGILDAADALRARRRESLAQLDTLLQSTFLDMFGDPVTNPKGWEVGSLGDLAENEDGKRVPVKKADREQMAGEFPYYGASGVIDSVDNYLFDGDRLLIGEDGANLVARATPVAFIAKGKYWVNNHAHVLAYNRRAELIFLEAMINAIDLKPYLSGTAQPKLNQKSLNRIPISSPPPRPPKTLRRHR